MLDAAQSLSIREEEGEADTSGEDSRNLDEVMKYGDLERALRRNMRRKGPGVLGMS